MADKKILIADDDDSMLWVLEQFLGDKGHETLRASDGLEAERLLNAAEPDLALLDINMPGKNGLDILKEKGETVKTPVIIMTAETTMQNTLEAMKLGAFDYISKPFDLNELEILVERALANAALKEKVRGLTERLKERLVEETAFVGRSRAVQNVFKTIGKIAPKDIDVLILGESGTGKELVARIIHANSARETGPFVAINSSAVPGELMESELFGYEKGAFTGAVESRPGKFELADKGTLFLDEVGDMSLDLQARLLRAVQEKEFFKLGGRAAKKVDVRIIAATNQDLDAAVKQRRFREDLYFRLNGVTIVLPPLRKRKADIEQLAGHFLEKFCRELSTEPKTLGKNALEELKNYRWPGNVRELENVIKRTIILSPSPVITPEDLDLPTGGKKSESLEQIISSKLRPFIEKTAREGNQRLYDLIIPFTERPLIKLVLEKTGGNQVRAAEVLGINRNTLRKKIKALKIDLKKLRE
ncbi:MAG: nitrogen fixation sigma-54 dependent transcriptional regulator GnfM [Thermodesulfobacteriota bacterium]|nr:MAG: nitrogen fixation sigma-54 dependent transcriptional regulator GnfM [Thermodesulfobacteriota bacterium]